MAGRKDCNFGVKIGACHGRGHHDGGSCMLALGVDMRFEQDDGTDHGWDGLGWGSRSDPGAWMCKM